MLPPKTVIEACLYCLAACENCITYCNQYGNRQCLLLCRDCADICALCARFEARNSQFEQDLYGICAKICAACALECAEVTSGETCYRECTIACKKCAEFCEMHISTQA